MKAHRSVLFRRVDRSVACLATLAALAMATGTAGQEPEIFGDEIEVRVINLEVRVTDKQGGHVAGLRPADFRLEIDGEEVPIDYFSEIRDRRSVAPAPAEPILVAGSAGSAEREVTPAVAPGERVGTSFVLFLDNYFSIDRDRQQVVDALRDTIAGLDAADRMIIVGFDGRRLEKYGDWASSPDVVEENLRQALAAPTRGLQRLGELGSFDRDRERQGSELIQEGDLAVADSYIRKLSRQVETVLQAATSTLRGFATPPGRKVMLLTSGGWPRDPSAYAVGFNPLIRSRTRHYFPDQAFDELVSTANLLGYTLYPIDVQGNRVRARGVSAGGRGEHIEGLGSGFGAAVANGLRPSGPSGPGPSGPAPVATEPATAADVFNGGLELDIGTDREIEVESALLELAEKTGGRALINSQRLHVLDEVLADTSSYYWLGFTPTRQLDDSEHEIRVRVAGKGLRVRSRRSYQDFSRRSEVAMEVESSLIFDTEVGEDLLEVELGTPKGKRRVRLPVTLRIPLDRVVMLPTAGGYEGRMELRVAAIDDQGDSSDLPAIPVRFGGPLPPQPGQAAFYDFELQLRNQQQKLVLVLHDLAGDAVLTATVDYRPPAEP